jgi:diguanylate cyclase (GGDEF)-like protein/PAS domain S-box-containing protein/putative nucleotidyltransferase with HDIG domain
MEQRIMKRATHQRSPQMASDTVLPQQSELLTGIVESSGDALFCVTEAGLIATWNGGAERIYGYTAQEAVGKDFAKLLWPADAHKEEKKLYKSLAQGEEITDLETTQLRKDGAPLLTNLTLSPLTDTAGTFLGILVVARDITESRQTQALREQEGKIQELTSLLETQQQELEALKTTDSMTGLMNRRFLQEQLDRECQRAIRYGTPLSLILLDIDHFRHYNDTYGHPAGDEKLRQLGRMLRQEARPTDLVARYDGELFCIVLPNTDGEGAVATAERLRAQIEATYWLEKNLTASLGAATFSHTMETGSALILEAHKALCISKREGRNLVTHFHDVKDFSFFHSGGEAGRNKTHWERVEPASKEGCPEDSIAVVNTASLRVSRQELAHAYDTTIEGWSRALELREKERAGHSHRVMEMTVRLAQEMGIGGQELVYMRWGALLHDIGEMGIPDSILLKTEPLTPEEWQIMRSHTTLAYEMLASIAFIHPALDIPFSHHERWDGTGYPQGLKGKDIPLAARIFAVVDVWDALRSDRPYRKAWSDREALDHIHSLSGKHFDPQVVQAFHQLALATREVSGSLSASYHVSGY